MGVENGVRARLVGRVDAVASMGPRHDGRGKRNRRHDAHRRQMALQWGHATMGVENARQPLVCALRVVLQWGHATMGVENYSWLAPGLKAAASLQWGHATMGVENRPAGGPVLRLADRFNGATPRWAWKTHGSPPGRSGLKGLQWGHATMGVENPVDQRQLEFP